MALCEKACCNSVVRAAEQAQRRADFEAWYKARTEVHPATVTITVDPNPSENDISYTDALARIEANPAAK